MIWNIIQNEAGEARLLEKGGAIPDGWELAAETANPLALHSQKHVPVSVTMRQGRLALLGAGLLDDVDAALAAIPDETMRRAAQIEWEYAQTIDRHSAWVDGLADALGLTGDQLDNLFVAAGQL